MRNVLRPNKRTCCEPEPNVMKTNNGSIYRFTIAAKRQAENTPDSITVESQAKKKKMQTSTPITYRIQKCSSGLDSSDTLSLNSSLGAMSISTSAEKDNKEEFKVEQENLDEIQALNLTPPKEETPVMNAAKTIVTGNHQLESWEMFRRRCVSLPNTSESILIKPGKLEDMNKSRSLSDLFIVKCKEQSIMLEQHPTTDSGLFKGNDGRDIEAKSVLSQEERDPAGLVPQAFVDQEKVKDMARAEGAQVDANTEDVVQAEGIDQQQLRDLVEFKMENKLPGIFKRSVKWQRGIVQRQLRQEVLTRTPAVKRKEHSVLEDDLNSHQGGTCSDVRPRVMRRYTIGEAPITPISGRQRRRKRCSSVRDPKQQLLPGMLKKMASERKLNGSDQE